MKVRVDNNKICSGCHYWGDWDGSCGYMVWEKKSRLIDENGNRYDHRYCDKFKPKKNKTRWHEMNKGNYKK